jgi:hypothetical protein
VSFVAVDVIKPALLSSDHVFDFLLFALATYTRISITITRLSFTAIFVDIGDDFNKRYPHGGLGWPECHSQ